MKFFTVWSYVLHFNERSKVWLCNGVYKIKAVRERGTEKHAWTLLTEISSTMEKLKNDEFHK